MSLCARASAVFSTHRPQNNSVLHSIVPVKGRACGHAPGEAPDSLLPEVWDGREVGSHDGQRVGRVHKEAVFSEDHVAVLGGEKANSLVSM